MAMRPDDPRRTAAGRSTVASRMAARRAKRKARRAERRAARAATTRPQTTKIRAPGVAAAPRPQTTKIRAPGAADDRKARNGVAVGSDVASDVAGANGYKPPEQRAGIAGKLAGRKGFTSSQYAGRITPGEIRGEGVQTREAGKFPVYGGKMQAAKSFRAAFADARAKGEKTFPWQGRKYTTDLA